MGVAAEGRGRLAIGRLVLVDVGLDDRLLRIVPGEEVADQEGLSVGEQDLRDRCAELARGTGRSPEQVQAAISKGGHLGDLRASVLERKVLEFLTVANSIREIDKAS